MMYTPGQSQRAIYKLIDQLLSAPGDDPIAMLSSLVNFMVDSTDVVVTGGRVWQFEAGMSADADSYVLRYQYGELESLKPGLRRQINEMPGTLSLASRATLTTEPIDMGERGMRAYSLTGVGDPVSSASGMLPPYAIAFTAHSVTEEFVDTMLVVSSAATTALRNQQAAVLTQALRKDLDTAWRIQRGLVPDHHVTYRDLDIYGVSVPDSVVGGDYFDYIHPTDSNDRLGVVLSDAASKGLPAAVQALFVSGAVRMGLSFDSKMSALVGRLNQLIYDTFPTERFVSLFYAEFMASTTGLVLYVNAGHCPPIHLRASSGVVEYLQPTGGILGIIQDQHYSVDNVNLAPGDYLVLYTDGISEALDASGLPFGEDRLAALVAAHSGDSPQVMAHSILEAVTAYSAGAPYTDDRTIVIIRRLPTG